MKEKTLRKNFKNQITKLNLDHLNLKYNFNPNITWYYGCFDESNNAVEFTPSVLGLPRKEVINTIRHEIAHAIDWHRNGKKWRKSASGRLKLHDKIWKQICVEIDCPPSRL